MEPEPDDPPVPVVDCCNAWMAVPTGDQAGVMAMLGLTALRPVGFAEAVQILHQDAHDEQGVARTALERVFVTPELDGWTLVIGGWCDPADWERCDEVLRLCRSLSGRYGRTQAYSSESGHCSAWLVTEHGAVVRRYAATGEREDDEPFALGEPLALEIARRRELGLPLVENGRPWRMSLDDAWMTAACELAPAVAADLGVSPLELSHDTPKRGSGLLALTPYAEHDAI
ncbi:hypothetical protein ACIBF1_19315 [Spirillospora sp. NPDC050679]